MTSHPAGTRGRGKRCPKRLTWEASSVRALRRHLGLSQTNMAEELGVRQQTAVVVRWLRTVAARKRLQSSTRVSSAAVVESGPTGHTSPVCTTDPTNGQRWSRVPRPPRRTGGH